MDWLKTQEFRLIHDWRFILIAGLFAGIVLSHFIDHLILKLRHWWFGETKIDVTFSPKGGCESTIVSEVNAAKSEILMQAYSFTSKPIAHALIEAVTRGVSVTVLLDKSNQKEMHTELGEILGHGIDVWIDDCHAIAHNKVMVIDERTIITGSFNFTFQAEHENAENLIVLKNHYSLAARYKHNIMVHKDHCHLPGESAPKPVHLRKAS